MSTEELCYPSCYDYTNPYAEVWAELLNWMWLKGVNWRSVP